MGAPPNAKCIEAAADRSGGASIPRADAAPAVAIVAAAAGEALGGEGEGTAGGEGGAGDVAVVVPTGAPPSSAKLTEATRALSEYLQVRRTPRARSPPPPDCIVQRALLTRAG